MTSPFTKVLMIGATTGIGRGMSERLIQEGSYVIATGRTLSLLQEFVQTHGSDKSSYAQFDMANLDSIPAFCENIVKQHPDIDCVWLNAGVQSPQNPVTLGPKFDMKKLEAEVTINYTAQVAITQQLLPHLKAQSKSTLLFTSSALAYIPFPNIASYSATKSAAHFYAMCVRDTLKREKSNVKVVELYPPVVQTELHGPQGRHLGIPLRDFVDQAWPGIVGGHENCNVGKSFAPEGFFEDVEMKKINTLSTALDKILKPPV